MNSIESTVSAWSGVKVDSHDRGGGREFTLDGREIGHIHRDKLVDIPFTKPIRDVLLEENRAEKHHVMPDSGWVSYRVQSDEDIEGALWLLRVAYLYHVVTLQNHEEETSTVDVIDIDAALVELDMSDTLDAVFDEVRAA
ncbi:luciferase domain-containing protein [Halocatena marina]|uniref:Luciferase family protein n=1 Tax=Halocatena marina TaxID=2934937 RepID=A0ABD5YXJ5_9EURY|nr:luciferase family protein [Halocatena marina]